VTKKESPNLTEEISSVAPNYVKSCIKDTMQIKHIQVQCKFTLAQHCIKLPEFSPETLADIFILMKRARGFKGSVNARVFVNGS